ncbi:MAG: cupredoxin domain-containing protein [Gemmatimonadota bacterium]|nr:cupredoxin domain-containing protein [Gemmatimonadota bacterium]
MVDNRPTTHVGGSQKAATPVNRRAFIGLGAAAVAGAGAVSIIVRGGLAQDGTPPAAGTPGASPEASPSASPVAGEGDVTIVMVDIAFEPTEFTIAADTDVVVSLPNEGMLEHNFVIDELDIATELVPGGESTTVTINAPAGTYEYYCSVAGHREAGMVGTLTVE